MQYWIVGIGAIVVAVVIGIVLKRLDAKRYETMKEENTKKDSK